MATSVVKGLKNKQLTVTVIFGLTGAQWLLVIKRQLYGKIWLSWLLMRNIVIFINSIVKKQGKVAALDEEIQGKGLGN